jgi:hypothetical protein
MPSASHVLSAGSIREERLPLYRRDPAPRFLSRESRYIIEGNILMNCSGPCDVWIPGASLGASRLTGAEAVAWLTMHAANQNARLTVRPWEASTSDHEALRDYQVYLIEGGRGLLPF